MTEPKRKAPSSTVTGEILGTASTKRRKPEPTAIVIFGATVGNLLMLHPLLIGQQFGPANYATIFSRSQLFVFVGTAAGPYVLGVLRDATGGYTAAYLVAGSLSLLGAMVLPRNVRN